MGNLCCCIGDGGRRTRRGKINVSPATQTQQPQPPYIEYEKPATIRNDVNLRKETLRLEPDPENPGQLLVSFSFDATVPGRITVVFFAEEDSEFNLTATKADTLPPITFDFEKGGLGQKYIQPSGTGVDRLSVPELFKEEVERCIYPLAVKIEAAPEEGSSSSTSTNAQITQVTFVKENGEVKSKTNVMKQFLWVSGSRYELQDIYGTGDASDQGKECVVCLSEPRDTIVLPCRHMCMCSGCAKALRFQKNECPVCRQPAERFVELEGNGNNNGDEHI
ncbi:putative E3 ubiquitin-protein ligase LUL1 [Raphanus sativus]|uniref:RING-type E3 ubiquitin transferase n=1 Tax=Raphanus sativus TaxID=3726 RepID=A0A6J0KVM5_RAPSA|nr:probable E3 ubiquitin-protein ligase LOG2 [Raphanus sativus]KAJ4911567.1 putative E3 ubiquitin-protein ligase LUL1 [Raphanus sativus]